MISIYSEGRYKLNQMRDLESGNPGIGGTEYLLIQLFYYLRKYHSDLAVQFLCTDAELQGEDIVTVENDLAALSKAGESRNSIFIFVPKDRDGYFYEALDKAGVCGIAWVHNYTSYRIMDYLATCEAIKRVIFVGRQHYDNYFDSKFVQKSDYIYNMISGQEYEYIPASQKRNIVTYVGVLIPTKGFHRLAAVWKDIVKQIPDAELYVIGSGCVYNGGEEAGKWGIASEAYEKKLAKYLEDSEGKLLDSVHLMGRLGREKDDILQKTKVGVANPTGKSETFCLSAVEFKKQGIPVVSYRGKGLLDTVRNGIDGKLIRSKRELRNEILKLLKDAAWNEELGRNGYDSGCSLFQPETVIEEWIRVIREVEAGNPARIRKPENFLTYDFKWLRYANHYVKEYLHTSWQSISYMVSWLKEGVKKVIWH